LLIPLPVVLSRLLPPPCSPPFPYTTLFRSFRLLLSLGADPARGDADGRTALHLAAMGRSPYWLETLLGHGMSPDTPNTLTGDIPDRKSTRLNSSHVKNSYAGFCLKKKNAHR